MWQQVPAPRPRCPDLPSSPVSAVHGPGEDREQLPSGGPQSLGSQLDSMLGSLQSDLNKLGVATVAKGSVGLQSRRKQVMRRGGGGAGGGREAGVPGGGRAGS